MANTMQNMSANVSPMPTPTNVDAEIGRRVFHRMWDMKITQTQMGQRIGVGQSTLSKKLRGERPWFSHELRDAASMLGVSVGYLFGENDGEVGPAGIEPTTSTVESGRFASTVIHADFGRKLA